MVRKLSFDGQSNDIYTSSKEQSNTRSEAQKERVSTACTYCRYRKVKCDGGKPSCGFCIHMGRNECVYAKVSEEENQHLRRRKRELRARRAAERIRAEQEQRANSQSPSSSAFILNNLDSSSPQIPTKRRRSSVPKRSRERSMAGSSVTSTPNLFSSSAPPQINQEFPPEMALSGLPAELTNTFSPNFLNLLTPQSNATVPNVNSNIDLGGNIGGNNSYTFPSTSMAMNTSAFDVNAPNLDWAYGGLSSSAPTASSSSSMLMDQRQEQEHFHQLHQAQDDQKAQTAPPHSIFALAASNNSFLGSMTGTLEMTIPDFKGPTLAMSNLRPSNEVQVKTEVENKPMNCFRQQSKEDPLNQVGQNDPLFTDMQVEVEDFNMTSSHSSSNVLEQDITAAKRRFSNLTEETQAIYSLWPTSPFHPDQSKRSSIYSPNEPSSMPELKRFLCTTNNPFSFNPVTPLAMSVNSSERNLFNFTNFAAATSPSSL
ncbi:uncharacterized protein FA14DRAFT_181571 [Meira miltonrushii]|uniref:Zn(2)-C6 fungal-type domain-containing protein n=1 Tax=Meira miltonrushii TaxID=1280837 RepID=A0A316V5X9_9BASI|nr:uncharacterized protein FA14DRAFT_181571 [Meira miltonrushii]PWN32896.1 hypothetical protein FA14DRAFT_181571 [Meira miltonrushii]